VLRRRHLVLAIGTCGQAATCIYSYGLASLVPRMRVEWHLSLARTGLVVSAPVLGLLATLVAWGIAADRLGERRVLLVGLLGAGLTLCAAPLVGSAAGTGVLLGVAGAFGASVNAASGRVVLAWFAPAERGTAMGVRQSAQPLGVALGGALLPTLAADHGIGAALLFPAVLCLVSAVGVALFVTDPPADARAAGEGSGRGDEGSPYADGMLVRVHLASALLVVPQFVTSAFAVAFLVDSFGWADVPAGRLLAVVALAGAAGRIAVGRWSDRVGSRLGPLRAVALTTAAAAGLLGLGAATGVEVLAVAALVAATTVSSMPNGLAFTAVAEKAGRAWAGRALGLQNTGQNATAVLVPPVFGALVGAAGFTAAFAVATVAPVLAALAVPVAAEHPQARRVRDPASTTRP